MAAPAAAQAPPAPAAAKDRAGDVRGALDIVRVAMERGEDGRLRGEITMADEWATSDLRAAAGPQGSLCFTLHVAREPGADPPDHLVCATPPPSGDELVGRVMRDRANGRPRTAAGAVATRPTTRTLYLRFSQSAVGMPAFLRFSAEAVTRAARCPRPLGCRDTAPDAPRTTGLTLRSDASPG
jgi:hypothetical protein